ncbi:hypothetical protein QFZ77_006492 [Paenibacillus sp. V4I3]|nr:hypothetical protein [Paenibacillus sp. V4I3]
MIAYNKYYLLVIKFKSKSCPKVAIGCLKHSSFFITASILSPEKDYYYSK